jgi:hypothetical protein
MKLIIRQSVIINIAFITNNSKIVQIEIRALHMSNIHPL